MGAGSLEEILTILKGLDEEGQFGELLDNKQGVERIQARSSEEIRKTLDFLSQFGLLKEATDKLYKILDRAKEGKITYEDLRKPIQQLAHLSSEEMMQMYEISYSLFSEKKFEQAASVAMLLSYINPDVSAFWRMLGMCYANLGDFKAALAPFLYASMVNSLELDNHLTALNCLSKLGFMQETLNYYNVAKEVLSDAQQWDDVHKLDQQVAGL